MAPSPQTDAIATPPPDRLKVAAGLLAALAVSFALAGLVLVMTPRLYSGAGAEKAARLLETLHLSHLALHPSGHPLRAPELSRPGVDLRHSAWLPFPEPGSGGLSPGTNAAEWKKIPSIGGRP
jgi:hypothetical protein